MVAAPELPPVSRRFCTLKSWGLLSTATTYRVDVGAEPVTVAVTAWFCGATAQGESALNVTCVDEKLMLTKMQKGERIHPFLTRLHDTQDQLTSVASTPQPTDFVWMEYNIVFEEWKVFF